MGFALVTITAAVVGAVLLSSGPRYGFEPNQVLEVDLQLEPDHWSELRFQHRCPFADFASAECADELWRSPYTWKTATVTIDGVTLSKVGLRKKGWGTTYISDRPGLKIRFDKHVPKQRWQGLRRLTLNTTPDPIRTCLAYGLLRDAKIPTPRCAFANVRVNGEALGIYPVVESIDRDFLEENFDRADGALFEGQLNDFRLDYRPRFERKWDRDQGNGPIDRLTTLLAREQKGAHVDIEAVVDLDAFYTFWAADGLIARWDGYAGHLNNFFVYVDPESERLHFIPWGGNRATFETLRDPVLSTPGHTMPESVIAHGILARRLYASEAGRDRYVRTLRSLLGSVWVEQRILERVDRMEKLLAPYPGERKPTAPIRRFVQTRRKVLEAELEKGPAPWPFAPPPSPCMVPAGTVRSSFSTAWTSSTAPASKRSAPAQLDIALDDAKLDVKEPLATAGPLGAVGTYLPHHTKGAASIVIGAQLPSQRVELTLVTPRTLLTPGNTIQLRDFRTRCDIPTPSIGLICIKGSAPCLQPAFVSKGLLTLSEAETREGATVSGRFQAELVRQPWGLFEGHPNVWHRGAPARSWIRRETRGYSD